MSKKLLVLPVLMTLGVSPLAYSEGSPWLPADGTTTVGLNLITGSTTDFFIADVSTSLQGDLDGTFLWFNASHGFRDVWSFDFRAGYARSEFSNDIGQEDREQDFADTTFGASYQFINEFEADNGWPTISGRVGLTIGGDYNPNLINAIGDAADGVDLSLLVGKSLGAGFAVYGDLTFRQRNNDVADGVQYLINVFYSTPLQGLGLQAAVAGLRTDSDVDIGGDGFGVDGFPQTDRDSDFLIAGVNYGFNNGIGIGLSYTALLNGRNVADTDVASFSLTYSF